MTEENEVGKAYQSMRQVPDGTKAIIVRFDPSLRAPVVVAKDIRELLERFPNPAARPRLVLKFLGDHAVTCMWTRLWSRAFLQMHGELLAHVFPAGICPADIDPDPHRDPGILVGRRGIIAFAGFGEVTTDGKVFCVDLTDEGEALDSLASGFAVKGGAA